MGPPFYVPFRKTNAAPTRMTFPGPFSCSVDIYRFIPVSKEVAFENVESNEMVTDFTPLHLAAGKGSLNIANLLVSAGADTTCPSIFKDGEAVEEVVSPYDVAMGFSHELAAYTLWSANETNTASKQSGHEFPAGLSAYRATIEAMRQTEEAIVRAIITTALSDHVGRRWRVLGRRLGITDVELDDIQYRCNISLGGLKEMTVESLLMWLDRQPYWPNIFDVWWALQDMQMEDVADLVLDKLTDERMLANVADDVEEDDEASMEHAKDVTEKDDKSAEAFAVTKAVHKSFFKKFQQLFISSPVFRWLRKFRFDAFVSANQRDFSWVNEWVQQLESPPHSLKICVHHRDFKSGVPISHNIEWAVANSRKILIVLSQNFLSSNWCKVELKAAIEKELSSDKYCVLPMLKSECEIPDELGHLTYLDCKDGTVDVGNNWCKVELKAAIEKELSSDKYCVLLMLKSECEIPDELCHLTYLDCKDGTVDIVKLASDIKSNVKKR
ncbi:TLR2 [Branchiostoma lanceolatum]|uniref:TLR2 protein n=1 Tax=Branchiostoma lanceolatum TaxID=7740 RepID=A0A8K0A5Q1_BRALA|nr:TLR2 [Branchiostoma lanceolatum]